MSSRARYGPTFGWLKIVSIVWFRSWSPVWPAGRTTGSPGNPREERLRVGVVQVRVERHRVDPVVAGVGAVGRGAGHLVDVPTGVDALELVDDRLVVGGQRAAGAVLRRAVLVEQLGPDREELHDLARVVLVRVVLRGRVHVQVLAHRRVQRLLVQDVPVVAERVLVEDAQVRRHLERVAGARPRRRRRSCGAPRPRAGAAGRAVERVGEEPVLDPVRRVVVPVARVVAGSRRVARPERETASSGSSTRPAAFCAASHGSHPWPSTAPISASFGPQVACSRKRMASGRWKVFVMKTAIWPRVTELDGQ